MPGMNGLEATRSIVRDLPGARIIALTMHRDKRYAIRMFEAGMQLPLLILQPELRETVLILLRRRGLGDQPEAHRSGRWRSFSHFFLPHPAPIVERPEDHPRNASLEEH